MLTICSRRVLEFGRSPAPTSATSDVQKSISTMEVAPSPAEKTLAHVLGAGPASVSPVGSYGPHTISCCAAFIRSGPTITSARFRERLRSAQVTAAGRTDARRPPSGGSDGLA